MKYFDLGVQSTIDSYCKDIEKMLNVDTDQLLKMAFEVFDYNQDGKICEMDLFAFVKIFGDDMENDLFSKVFAHDILVI